MRRIATAGSPVHWLAVLRESGPAARPQVELAARRWGLSPRQTQVLELLVDGQANKSIAATLGVMDNTVEVHVSAIFAKAQASSRTALVALVWRQG
jgi:DNA-binding NarL/FixJ family response regulator